MGRTYAGILGPLAFCTVVARGLIDGADVESTMKLACICLFGFALFGLVVGKLAAWIVEEAVMIRLKRDLLAYQKENDDGPSSFGNV